MGRDVALSASLDGFKSVALLFSVDPSPVCCSQHFNFVRDEQLVPIKVVECTAPCSFGMLS